MALLGIECGATSSIAILEWGNKQEMINFEPANFRLLSGEKLGSILTGLRETAKARLPVSVSVEKVAIGLPGVLTDDDRAAVKSQVDKVWPDLQNVWAGSDIEIAFSCLEDTAANFKCLVISGTGSVCYGQSTSGTTGPLKVGGYGHILGDRGSGYSIGLNGLRAALKQWEYRDQSILLQAIMKQLDLATVSDLVSWSVSAPKSAIASLATVVAQYWIEYKDEIATEVMINAVHELGTDLLQLITKLDTQDGDKILIGLAGSLFTDCEPFTEAMGAYLREILLKKDFEVRIVKETVRGSLSYIRDQRPTIPSLSYTLPVCSTPNTSIEEEASRAVVLPTLTALSPTEERNPASKALDRMLTLEAIELFLKEERSVYTEIRREAGKISQLILKVSKAFKEGGRLFYVGAGTSGRMGILDASECPPTFKAPHQWVQGIIAGGHRAVFKAVEGAEDSVIGGALAIQARAVTSKDIVLGIAASGRTPFVWGALYEAKKKCKAHTCLLTFNPNIIPKFDLDMVLTVDVGPEILTGSTRLKCGTATKCVLNMLTTLSMVKYGKCLENLMVDLMACNDKLRDRAGRIVMTILEEEQPELTREDVDIALKDSDYDIKKVVREFRSKKVQVLDVDESGMI